jgi:hypothetical protein
MFTTFVVILFFVFNVCKDGLIIQGKQIIPCLSVQGFCEKYKPSEARSGDFSQNRRLDLARNNKQGITFAVE